MSEPRGLGVTNLLMVEIVDFLERMVDSRALTPDKKIELRAHYRSSVCFLLNPEDFAAYREYAATMPWVPDNKIPDNAKIFLYGFEVRST